MTKEEIEILEYLRGWTGLRKNTTLRRKESKELLKREEDMRKATARYNWIEHTNIPVDLEHTYELEYKYRLLNMQLKMCGNYLNYLDDFEKQLKAGMIPSGTKKQSLEEYTMQKIKLAMVIQKEKENKRILRREKIRKIFN